MGHGNNKTIIKSMYIDISTVIFPFMQKKFCQEKLTVDFKLIIFNINTQLPVNKLKFVFTTFSLSTQVFFPLPFSIYSHILYVPEVKGPTCQTFVNDDASYSRL